MTQTLANIAIVLRNALRNIDGINDRVYPLVATDMTTYPYIVYRRQSLDLMHTKDGPCADTATFEVQIVTDSYMAGLELVDSAIHYLSHIGTVDGVTYHAEFESFSEMWVENAYVQTIVVTL